MVGERRARGYASANVMMLRLELAGVQRSVRVNFLFRTNENFPHGTSVARGGVPVRCDVA